MLGEAILFVFFSLSFVSQTFMLMGSRVVRGANRFICLSMSFTFTTEKEKTHAVSHNV